jgi:hypothetical protein
MTFKIGDQVKCLRVSPEMNLDGTVNDNSRCIKGHIYNIDNVVHSALCGNLISISGELHAEVDFELYVPPYYRYYKSGPNALFKYVLRQGDIAFCDGDSNRRFAWAINHDNFVKNGVWTEISKEDTIERKYESVFVDVYGHLLVNRSDSHSLAKPYKELKFDSKGFYFV